MFPFAKGLSDVAYPLITSTTVSAKGNTVAAQTWIDAFRLLLPSLQFIFFFVTADKTVSALLHQLILSIICLLYKNDIFQMCFISTNFFYRPNIKNRQLFPLFGIQIKPYPNILLRHSLSFRRSEKWQTCSLSRYRELIITRSLFIS